jgi:hypothetical protein
MSSAFMKNDKSIMILTGSNNSTLNTTINENDEVNELGQTIIYVILFVLIVFMCLFIYNLVKCYLPVWLGNKKAKKERNLENTTPHYDLEAVEDHTI